MSNGIGRPFRFFMERWIQKGIHGQLVIMAGLIALVAFGGGLVAWAVTSRFDGALEAVWWAFLRLTDPGYLGDDEGAVLRTISTVITVLGYVLFMGSMIAIMTQWLARTLKDLESGVTPIAMKGHIVILGWTNRTTELIKKLLGARGRLQRFLQHCDTRKLRIVVLSDDAGAERRLELRADLGELWNSGQIFLRAGSSLHSDHLERLDLRRASVILIPGADFELGGAELTDTRVVKTLMTVNKLLRPRASSGRPHVVAEIFDAQKAPIARDTIDRNLEVVASNRIISRLISQSVRHSGLGHVLMRFFLHREAETLYLRGAPELAGHTPRALASAYRSALVLGFLRREGDAMRVIMDPCTKETMRPEDLVIFLARSYDDCQPSAAPRAAEQPVRNTRAAVEDPGVRRLLVLGWSHKIGALIAELNESGTSRHEITIMSRADPAEREDLLKHLSYDGERIRVRNIRGNYSIEAELAELQPQGFDNVVFLASDWQDSSEAADARTILGYTLLSSLLKDVPDPPEVLLELLDPDNATLWDDGRQMIFVTPRLLSHFMAHVALLPELNALYDELFGAGGSEIQLWTTAELELEGKTVSFDAIGEAAYERGASALGILHAPADPGEVGAIRLIPGRDRTWPLTRADKIVVLTANGYDSA